MKIISSLFALLILSACAGQFQGLEQPNKDEALVYYYRPWKYIGAALPLDIIENGTPIASLGVNEYKVHRTTPGDKTASTKTVGEYDYLPFTAKKGESYFVRAERSFCLNILGCVQINLVPKEKALAEIRSCDKVD